MSWASNVKKNLKIFGRLRHFPGLYGCTVFVPSLIKVFPIDRLRSHDAAKSRLQSLAPSRFKCVMVAAFVLPSMRMVLKYCSFV